MTEQEYRNNLKAFPNDRRDGMTLRDYFAAKAMQPLIVSFTIQDINWTSEQAYKIADAMMKAREA